MLGNLHSQKSSRADKLKAAAAAPIRGHDPYPVPRPEPVLRPRPHSRKERLDPQEEGGCDTMARVRGNGYPSPSAKGPVAIYLGNCVLGEGE